MARGIQQVAAVDAMQTAALRVGELGEGGVELSRAQQRPPVDRVAEREVGVERQRRGEFAERTVVLACSLFFAGIAPQVRRIRLRTMMVVLAGLLFLTGLVALLMLPVA